MPLYDFQCSACRAHEERLLPLSATRGGLSCGTCGGDLKRVIVLGHGGFQSLTPRWLDDETKGCLQDTDAVAAGAEKPIEDRADYNRYLQRHNIVPLH